MISYSHIKNSSDLLNKITNIIMENKLLAILNVKLLYTNILVNKCVKRLEIHPKKSLHCVMARVLDYSLEVSEFEHQSRY